MELYLSYKKIPVKQLHLNIFSTCSEGEHTKLIFFEFTITFNTITAKKSRCATKAVSVRSLCKRRKRNFLVKHQGGVKCDGNISN